MPASINIVEFPLDSVNFSDPADPAERIAAVRRTREAAASNLLDALRGPGEKSERGIQDRWLHGMGKLSGICAEGWYQPPPGGAAVLVGHAGDAHARLNYHSLRHEQTWSRSDIPLADDSLVYAYASPFDRNSAMIGDIGVTLYRGADDTIRRHLATCWELTRKVAGYAEVGMELRTLFRYSQREIRSAELVNETSATRSGLSNIGHTLPWSYGTYSAEALRCLHAGDTAALRSVISDARVSIDDRAVLRIEPDMALTVEPQISAESAPLCSYHVIVAFSGGVKEIISCFEDLFDEYGMEAYLPREGTAG
ncbi:hypothetical protein [Streptomyces sp. NPDC047000]|uniref:hypothetical protein n=1 Tax=Streptomyces sp. NPDC047000 TaxID=3155474 RepID=UPI0033C78439